MIKSIKIESHLKRCYNAHNRNVQICQARSASERGSRTSETARQLKMPASGAFKNCRTVINAQRKIRSTWRPEAAQCDRMGQRPSHWELTLSRGMGMVSGRQWGGCKGFTGNHFSSASRQTTTNCQINGSMKQFNALQCPKVNRTV